MTIFSGRHVVIPPIMGVRSFAPRNAAAPPAGFTDWWDLDNTITGCLYAYQPIGAASLAASYTNLDVPATRDCAPVAAPGWDTGTGWAFNGTPHYLVTGAGLGLGDQRPFSAVARVTLASAGAYRAIIGSASDSGLEFRVENDSQLGIVAQGVAEVASSTSSISAGVSVVVGFTLSAAGVYAFFIDGADAGSGTNNVSVEGWANWQTGGGGGEFWSGDIAAIAVYTTVLTAGNMSDLATALAAL